MARASIIKISEISGGYAGGFKTNGLEEIVPVFPN
jgi:hypothetical protein